MTHQPHQDERGDPKRVARILRRMPSFAPEPHHATICRTCPAYKPNYLSGSLAASGSCPDCLERGKVDLSHVPPPTPSDGKAAAQVRAALASLDA